MLNRIKKLCKEKNIAYKDLSNMTGVSISTLSKIMSSVIKDPSIVTVSKIAGALNVSVDYLVYGEKTNTAETQKNTTDEGHMLYDNLDTEDKAEIRGEMKQMLKADKYLDKDLKSKLNA